ncbi:MAG: EamA family transporter [Sporichthyaceae bacterium]|nr:EamA family transporter [Sporichthyaceae bacterium]
MTATGTSGLVIVVVLVAALCHAGWNAVIKSVPDSQVGMAVMNGFGAAIAAILVLIVPPPNSAAWPYLITSAVLHLAYSGLLAVSYRLGDFNQVYPLARGLAPLLVAGVAPVVAAEHLSGPQLVALGLMCGGLGGLVFAGGLPTRAGASGVAAAAATGVLIAGYTVVDGLGVRASDSSISYIAWLLLLFGPVSPLLLVLRRGVRRSRPSRSVVLRCIPAGLAGFLGYGLVLWAQSRGSLALVAALRETSVLFGAAIGALVFSEPFGRARTASAALITGGIVLLNLA